MSSASAAIDTQSKGVAVTRRAARSDGKHNALRKLNPRSYADRYSQLVDLSGEAITKLGQLMREGATEAIQFNAAVEILNRVDGKPRQQVQIEAKTDLTTMHLDALRALAAQAPEIIDITPAQTEQAHGE